VGVVIGIDPCGHGFHAFAQKGRGYLLYPAVAKPNARGAPCWPISNAHREAIGLVSEVRNRWGFNQELTFFIEEAPVAGARNLRTALKLAMSVGAIAAAITGFTERCYLVPVDRWKKGTVGHGGASKPDVALWLSGAHPEYSVACDGSQDLIDACAISCYGIQVVADAALVSAVGSDGQL
jgi:hypothetical protein